MTKVINKLHGLPFISILKNKLTKI